MPAKEIYEFAIIRLVPKVERGEFLNIGIVLFSKRFNYLGIKYIIDEKRLSALSDEIDFQAIREYLAGWESVCKGGSEAGEIGALEMHERFRWLTAARSTIIQNSAVHPGKSCDPQQELEDLFNKYVL